jgi:hypothetical protein
MAKKKTPQQEVYEIAERVTGTVASWKSHKVNGCNDPFYPDGLNMNLLRNHLFYYKRKIRELCAEHNLLLPPEAFTPDLPYTDCNYFAKPKSDRAVKIMDRPGWECCNHESIGGEYHDRQLSLF